MIRLNKYIADSGIASRRKAEEFILDGRVSVNNKTVIDFACKVEPGKDVVMLDGEKIYPKKHLYFLLNKPKGVVTTTDDEKNRKTVVELIRTNERIYPVGRLDYNTTGVLLLTNDGDFSNLLTHPKSNVQRIYEVRLDRSLTEEDEIKLLKGVYINKTKGKFIKIEFPKQTSSGKRTGGRNFIEVTCLEGRNHFVKNMFGTLGYTVVNLNRKIFAGIHADIPVGAYRVLSTEEVKSLIEKYGK